MKKKKIEKIIRDDAISNGRAIHTIADKVDELVMAWNEHMVHHGLLDYANDLIDRKEKE